MVRTAAAALCCLVAALANACFDRSTDPNAPVDGGALHDAQPQAETGAVLDATPADGPVMDAATDALDVSIDAASLDAAVDAPLLDASSDASPDADTADASIDAPVTDAQSIDVLVVDVIQTQLVADDPS
jgi:hypothetical protein